MPQLYVGNLAYETTDDKLKEHFSQAGQVTAARVITDKFTGKARGFGFVEMATEEDTQAAIDQFDGTQFAGRTLKVNVAQPKPNRT